MKPRFALLVLASFLLMTGLSVRNADAATNLYRFVVPTLTSDPNDLHATFTGTGGSIANVTVTPAPATTGVSGGGNTIDVTWSSKLPAGTVVVVKFTTAFANIALNNANWTNDGTDLGAATGGPVAPGASPLVIALLALAIVAAGAWMLRRRTATA